MPAVIIRRQIPAPATILDATLIGDEWFVVFPSVQYALDRHTPARVSLAGPDGRVVH